MKRPFFAILCVFIILFALANKCDKSASTISPVETDTSYITPAHAIPAQPDGKIETNTSETNICDECGGRFFGRGFTEVAHGEWQETKEPYQSFICSRACGMQHTKNWEIKLQELNYDKTLIRPAQGTKPHSYNDDPCGLCGGTGYESNRYGDARICPQCDGSGKRNN